jgi:hypothetical protein
MCRRAALHGAPRSAGRATTTTSTTSTTSTTTTTTTNNTTTTTNTTTTKQTRPPANGLATDLTAHWPDRVGGTNSALPLVLLQSGEVPSPQSRPSTRRGIPL